MINYCFHGIGTPHRDLEPGESEYWIPKSLFCDILDQIVSSDAQVELSVDDGNPSDLEVVVPALQQRGLNATFFIVAERLGKPNWIADSDLQQIACAGMAIGNHGWSHQPWRDIATPDLERQLRSARCRLQEAAGADISFAAPPYGAYDRRVLEVLRRQHYQALYTVDGGHFKPGAWLQVRHAVRRDDSPHALAKLACARPHPAISAVRSMKRGAKRWRSSSPRSAGPDDPVCAATVARHR